MSPGGVFSLPFNVFLRNLFLNWDGVFLTPDKQQSEMTGSNHANAPLTFGLENRLLF